MLKNEVVYRINNFIKKLNRKKPKAFVVKNFIPKISIFNNSDLKSQSLNFSCSSIIMPINFSSSSVPNCQSLKVPFFNGRFQLSGHLKVSIKNASIFFKP